MIPAERKELADAFRAAKGLLWDGTGDPKFAIIERSALLEIGTNSAYSALAVIRERLKGAYSLHEWLISQGVDDSILTIERIQAHRHAWLDLLIDEFDPDPMKWRDGEPPHVGFWSVKDGATNPDIPEWRWWDGEAWGVHTYENESAEQAASDADIWTVTENIQWRHYYPDNARVPRVAP